MKKLRCSQVKRIIATRDDRQWPSAVKAAIEAHLAGCPSCRRDLALTELIKGALRHTPVRPAPSDFAASVMQKISDRHLITARRLARWLPAPSTHRAILAAATLALLVLCCVFVYVRHHSQALPQAPTEVAQAPSADLSLVQQLVFYHEQAAAQEIGTDAGVLMARAGP